MCSDKWAVEIGITIYRVHHLGKVPTPDEQCRCLDEKDNVSRISVDQKKNSNLFVLKDKFVSFSRWVCVVEKTSVAMVSHCLTSHHQPPKPQTLSFHILCACLLARIISHYSFECLDRCRNDGCKRRKIYGGHSFDRPADQYKTKTLESTPPTCIFLVCLTSLGVLKFFRRAQGTLSDSMVEGHFCYIWFDMRWRKQGSWRV
jgi:hypothetical protein